MILGAGYGIGKIGSAAVESMARQPEVAGNVQTAMIIAAALIEGATFFALIVCMLFNNVGSVPFLTMHGEGAMSLARLMICAALVCD